MRDVDQTVLAEAIRVLSGLRGFGARIALAQVLSRYVDATPTRSN